MYYIVGITYCSIQQFQGLRFYLIPKFHYYTIIIYNISVHFKCTWCPLWLNCILYLSIQQVWILGSYLLSGGLFICRNSIRNSLQCKYMHSHFFFNHNSNITSEAQLKFNFDCRPSMVITFRKGFNLFLEGD